MNDLVTYLQVGILLIGTAIGWLTIAKLRKEKRLLGRKEREGVSK